MLGNLHLVTLTLFLCATVGPEARAAAEATENNEAEASNASTPVPEPSWMGNVGLVGGVNNVLGGVLLHGRYRDTYGRDPESKLFNNTYWQAGFGTIIGVFQNQLTAHLEWSPIAIFKLRLGYTGVWLTGLPSTFGVGATFEHASDSYGDEQLESRKGEGITAFWNQLALAPTLQAKVGRVVAVNTFTAAAHYIHDSDDFVFNNRTDSLIRGGALDWTLEERFLLLLDLGAGTDVHQLLAGGVYQYNQAVRSGIKRHRVGAMLSFTAAQRWGALYEPTVIFMTGLNLVDRNRQGQLFGIVVLRTGIPF